MSEPLYKCLTSFFLGYAWAQFVWHILFICCEWKTFRYGSRSATLEKYVQLQFHHFVLGTCICNVFVQGQLPVNCRDSAGLSWYTSIQTWNRVSGISSFQCLLSSLSMLGFIYQSVFLAVNSQICGCRGSRRSATILLLHWIRGEPQEGPSVALAYRRPWLFCLLRSGLWNWLDFLFLTFFFILGIFFFWLLSPL